MVRKFAAPCLQLCFAPHSRQPQTIVGFEAPRRPGQPLRVKEWINERDCNSAPENSCSLEASLSWEGRHGVSHLRRVRHLHHFRCGLSLLCREEPLRADSRRSARDAHLLHHLSAFQQSDDPLCGRTSGTRQTRRIPALLAAHDHSRRPLSLRYRPGMATLDLRTWADYFHEPFSHNALLPRAPPFLYHHLCIN